MVKKYAVHQIEIRQFQYDIQIQVLKGMEQDKNCPSKTSQQLTEHPKEEERTLSLLSFLSTQFDSKIFTLLSFLFDVRR